jgi:8-oxo-dGTP pyrophosphatase MutT (NUDIX family)
VIFRKLLLVASFALRGRMIQYFTGLNMYYEKSAGAVVYFCDAEQKQLQFLVIQSSGGHWDFPKGKIEEGETLRETTFREVKEETGLDVVLHKEFEQRYTYLFKGRDGITVNKEVTMFIARARSKDVVLSHEHIYFKWLDKKAAVEQLTYNNARQILEMADQFIFSQGACSLE